MLQKSISLKVAWDLFWVQKKWTLWFIAVILVVHIVKIVSIFKTQNSYEDFFISSYISSSIYMFVIGIISVFSFLPFYVGHGVTRKDLLSGGAIAALGLSVGIALSSWVLGSIEHMIIHLMNLPLTIDNSSINELVGENDDGLFASLLINVVASPFIDPNSNFLLLIVVYSLNILTYYFIGWLIGAGYYRFDWITGFGFIALALVFFMIGDLIWGSSIAQPFSNWLPFSKLALPLYASIIGTILLSGVLLLIIRQLTSKVAIKM